LSEEDIDKIATAVKQKITVDIESIITAKTEPLIFRISKLERHLNVQVEWDCLFVAFCCVESTLLENEFSRDELIWYTGRFIDSR
jgi:hypothetical protein